MIIPKNKLKVLLFYLIIFAIAFIVGINYSPNANKENKENFNNNEFSLSFTNEAKKTKQIRYKYILDYETINSEIFVNLDESKPLFTLSSNGTILKSVYPLADKEPIIPEISKTIKLKPNETTSKLFKLEVDQQANEIKKKIRFQGKIIIEEIIDKRWVPVYQGILMERGPYWSLDKGPIERLP